MEARIVAERCTYVRDSSEREGAEAGAGGASRLEVINLWRRFQCHF